MLSVVDVVVVVALILRPPFEACTTAYYRTRTHARTHESTLVVYEGFHSSCKYTADRRRIIHLHTGNFYAIVRNSHIAIHFWTQNAYGKCFPLRRRFGFDGPHCGNNYASAREPPVRYIGNNSDRISEVVLRCLRIAAITRSGAAFADARSALGCTVHFLFGFLEMVSRCGSGASKINCIMLICVAFHIKCVCVRVFVVRMSTRCFGVFSLAGSHGRQVRGIIFLSYCFCVWGFFSMARSCIVGMRMIE